MSYKLGDLILPSDIEERLNDKNDPNRYYMYNSEREANPNQVIEILVEKIEELERRVAELEKPNSVKFITED